jgi:formylglycine-generating enzyme required for sulfatase activity
MLDSSYLSIQSRKLADIYAPKVRSLLKMRTRKVAGVHIPTALTAEDERTLKPGDRFQECASCPQMVVIPTGEFMMWGQTTATKIGSLFTKWR